MLDVHLINFQCNAAFKITKSTFKTFEADSFNSCYTNIHKLGENKWNLIETFDRSNKKY